MNQQQVITECIKRAEKNGWDHTKFERVQFSFLVDGAYDSLDMASFLFDHEWAKCFFGEELINKRPTGNMLLSMPPQTEYNYDVAWQYHLQQLALSENRIKYLKDYLNNQ